MSRYCEKDETTVLSHVALKIFIVIYSPKATGFGETAQDERKSQQQEENNQSVYLFHVCHPVGLNEGYMCHPWTHSTPLVMYTCGTVFITMALWRGNSNWPRILSIQCHHKLPQFLSSDSVQPSLEKYRTIYPRDLHLKFTLNVNHKMENMFVRSCIVALG